MSLAIAGCSDDPPTPTEVRTQISSDLGNVLREAVAAVDGGTESLPGAAALGMADRLLGTGTTIEARVTALATRATRLVARHRSAGARPAIGEDQIDVDAEIAYLNDKLFTDANHLGDGIYQVPASLVCAETDVDTNGHPIEIINAKCAEQLAKADLRIRTAKDGGALVFAIQLDADHDEPLSITLTHQSIAATVNLDDMQHAFVALAGVFGTEAPNVALSGQATGKLEILGTAKAKATVSIDRAISVKFAEAGGDLAGTDAFTFASAKAEVLSITLDGAAKSGSLAVGLGETAVQIPDGDGRFELDLPGVTADAKFTSGSPLELTHLGLGGRSTTVSINGRRAMTIDLNAQDGRALGATLSLDAVSGAETIAVAPRLDLQMAIDHSVLGDDQPVYDVTRVLLDGSLRGGGAGNQIQVATGSFSVTTNPASFGFSAAAGQCVTGTDETDPTTGSSFLRWTAGACQ